MIYILFLLLTCAAAPGAAYDAGAAAQEFNARYVGTPKRVEVLGGWAGNDSAVSTETLRQVTSEKEWVELWDIHAPKTPPPAVDFSTAMVVAVFFGANGNVADSPPSVRTVERTAFGLELIVQIYPGDAIEKSAASPYLLVVLPRSSAEIEVTVRGDMLMAHPHLHYRVMGSVP